MREQKSHCYTEQDVENMADDRFINYLSQTYTNKIYRATDSQQTPSSLQNSRMMKSCDLLHHNVKRLVDFDYRKNSPIAELRIREKKRCRKDQNTQRRLRNLDHLKEEIEQNHNVFLRGVLDTVPNMEIQNILWEKNYRLKSAINAVKQENNALRAKAWNFSKENRKMKRQIDSWDLERSMIISENKKPYIDSTTMEKVFRDQEFSVVSMKIELTELGRIIQEKEALIEQSEDRVDSFVENAEMIGGELTLLGKDLFRYINEPAPESSIEVSIKHTKDKISVNADRIRLLQRQINTNRNNKANYQYELEHLEKPVRRYTAETYIQMKKSAVMVKQVEQEPTKVLAVQIKRQTEKVESLEYKVQQLINESVLQKQNIRKKIKEVLKSLNQQQ